MLDKFHVYLWKKDWLSNLDKNKIYYDKKLIIHFMQMIKTIKLDIQEIFKMVYL